MDDKLGKDVQNKLQIIQRKVRDIEASNALEVRGLQEKIDALTQERDALKKNVTALEISCSDVKESLTQSIAYHKTMQVALEKAQANNSLVTNERDQLQMSLSHMEGLLTASRISGKSGESAMRETQRNYEARVEELEGTVRGLQGELRKSQAASDKAQRSIDGYKKLTAEKDAEIAMLQETVRKECVERTLLLQQTQAGGRLAFAEPAPPQPQQAPQDVMMFNNQDQEVSAVSQEDTTWKKLKSRKKR